MRNIDKLKYDVETKLQFEYLLSQGKDELDRTFQKTKNDLISQSDIIKEVIVHANVNNWTDIKNIYNTLGFVVLSSLDLKTYIQILIRTNDMLERISIVRMIFTQIYEIGEDLNYLTGRSFQASLEKINANNELLEIRNVRNDLIGFKHIYDDDIRSIRITIGAHREQDYMIFHNMLCDIDYTVSISLVIAVDNILNKFGTVMNKIMNRCIEYVEKNYKRRDA